MNIYFIVSVVIAVVSGIFAVKAFNTADKKETVRAFMLMGAAEGFMVVAYVMLMISHSKQHP